MGAADIESYRLRDVLANTYLGAQLRGRYALRRTGLSTLNIIDARNCEVLAIEIATSIPSLRVTRGNRHVSKTYRDEVLDAPRASLA